LSQAWRDERDGAERGGASLGSAQEKTSTCAVSALLRTRIDQGAPQGRFLDPTTTVGLQAPTSLLAPSGYSIGSSKASPVHEHRRGLYDRRRPHSGTLSRLGALCKPVERIAPTS